MNTKDPIRQYHHHHIHLLLQLLDVLCAVKADSFPIACSHVAVICLFTMGVLITGSICLIKSYVPVADVYGPFKYKRLYQGLCV